MSILVCIMKNKSIRYIKHINLVIAAIAVFCCIPQIFCACVVNNIYDGQVLRLHVRANSDSAADQSVKYAVRDSINTYLESRITEASDFATAYAKVSRMLPELEAIANSTLRYYGKDYTANVKLCREYFPTRAYRDVTLKGGEYDALIVELGEAQGNNWWCVIYPPLCYGSEFEYKSIIAELFS